MSRARLGFYIFGRIKVFEGFPEIAKTFENLKLKSTKLKIFPGETIDNKRKDDEKIEKLEEKNAIEVNSFNQMYEIVQSLLKEKIKE